jgi:hypothetical protein
MAKERRISDWYKEKIEENLFSPPSEVWENIENELDIHQVWNRVSNQLDRIKLFSTIKRFTFYSAAAIVLFFILEYFFTNRITTESLDQESLSLDNFEDRQEEAKPFNAENKLEEINTKTTAVQDIEKPTDVSEIREFEEIPLKVETTETTAPAVMAEHQSGEPGSQETKSLERWTTVDSILMITPIETGNRYFMSESTEFHPVLQPPYHQDLVSAPAESKLYLRGFYIGLSAQLGNTWLINSTTVNGLKSHELNTTVPYFGKSFGLLAGKNLSEKFTLQFEAAFIDEAGQKYNEYIHGQYVTRVLSLDYTTFNIHLRYGSSQLWAVNTPISGNLIFGPFVSYLKSASEIIDVESENIKYHYQNLDYGMIAGYEFDFHLKRGFLISTGLRIKIGIPNVYAGNELIPSTFNKTRTASVNLSFGLKYYISRK